MSDNGSSFEPAASDGPAPSNAGTVPDEPTAVTVIKKLVLKSEPDEADIPEEPEDLIKQKAEGDFSGEYGKRVYCRRHVNSMFPIKIIFLLGGRFPFSCLQQADGTYLYKFRFYYPLGIYFLLSTVIMFATLIFGCWNVAHISLNISITPFQKTKAYQEEREYEEVLIQRYYIPLIFVYSSLMHGCISALLIIKKRHYIAHYLTFWSKAVYTMHMDVSRNARNFTTRILICFILIVVALTLLAVYKIGPSAIGLPTVFGDLSLRMFIKKKLWLVTNSTTRKFVQYWGAFSLVLTFTASKSAILFFIYHCKTLQSAFSYWNGRVYAAVLRGGEFVQTEEGRTTYKLLFKDHCILMDLMEGMNQVFSFTVESYFGCQVFWLRVIGTVFSLFFELYFCIRTAKQGDKLLRILKKRCDWVPGIIMVCLSMSLMFSAAKSAAEIAEEAMAGLEVLRRKTMLGRKTDEELYFMLSMFSSYTAYKKLEISAAGYYYMNKDFLIGLLSSVLSYFIILYQFQPVMDISYPARGETRQKRIKFGKFLTEIEGLDPEHYETTTSKVDTWGPFRNQ